MSIDPRTRPIHQATAVFVAAGLLLLVLQLRIVAAFLCAVGTYALYRQLLIVLRSRLPRAAHLAAAMLTLFAFALLGVALVAIVELLQAPGGGLPGLLQLLAETISQLRERLPPWLAQRIPDSAQEVQHAASAWLASHAHDLQRWGRDVLRFSAQMLLGFVIGLLAAFRQPMQAPASAWEAAARIRVTHVLDALAQTVEAQFRIAAVNTALTAAFILVVLPAMSVQLPLARTLVILTFVAGMLPIVGNLVSNAAIVLVALTISPATAIAAAAYLVAIHKLEYFLNAHFVARSTRVPAPALLAAMLILEAAYGLSGLVCAPIYCAWVYRELRDAAVI